MLKLSPDECVIILFMYIILMFIPLNLNRIVGVLGGKDLSRHIDEVNVSKRYKGQFG